MLWAFVSGALPPHLARLYAGVDDATALESSRCSRSEDVHVCPAAAGTGGADDVDGRAPPAERAALKDVGDDKEGTFV